jgi:hypothetical protein
LAVQNGASFVGIAIVGFSDGFQFRGKVMELGTNLGDLGNLRIGKHFGIPLGGGGKNPPDFSDGFSRPQLKAGVNTPQSKWARYSATVFAEQERRTCSRRAGSGERLETFGSLAAGRAGDSASPGAAAGTRAVPDGIAAIADARGGKTSALSGLGLARFVARLVVTFLVMAQFPFKGRLGFDPTKDASNGNGRCNHALVFHVKPEVGRDNWIPLRRGNNQREGLNAKSLQRKSRAFLYT